MLRTTKKLSGEFERKAWASMGLHRAILPHFHWPPLQSRPTAAWSELRCAYIHLGIGAVEVAKFALVRWLFSDAK